VAVFSPVGDFFYLIIATKIATYFFLELFPYIARFYFEMTQTSLQRVVDILEITKETATQHKTTKLHDCSTLQILFMVGIPNSGWRIPTDDSIQSWIWITIGMSATGAGTYVPVPGTSTHFCGPPGL
jgi:hypothetical protein